MCNFFSFVGDGEGRYLYTTRAERDAGITDPDSHTAILTRHGIAPKYQDRWTKYEFKFDKFTGKHEFIVDEPVEGHDHQAARDWVEALDFVHAVGYAAYYKSCIESYKSDIENYKSCIERYKSCIERCKSGIESYKSDIENYKSCIERCKSGIERYKSYIESYKKLYKEWKIREAR